MPTADATFTARRDALWPQALGALRGLIGQRPETDTELERIAASCAQAYADRPAELRALDERRLVTPDWYQRSEMVGYLAYADRFAGTPGGVVERIGYLQQLGVNHLHLLPMPGERFEPADLRGLGEALRGRGIALGVDAGPIEPDSFDRLFDEVFALANAGVEVIRIDPGKVPEVHILLIACRALLGIVAPGVLLLAGATPNPGSPVDWFGRGIATGAECQLAYQPTVPTMLWSALAEQDVRLTRLVLNAVPAIPPNASWVLAARSPADLDFDISNDQAAALGLDGAAHRSFLADFYSGEFPGSFASGEVSGRDPETGDRRIAGTLASLAGLERARSLSGADRQSETDLAIRRILLLHALTMSLGGLPMINSGDELGQFNDRSYLADPALAADGHWLHRPPLDWAAAARRFDPTTAECRIFSGLANLVEARRRTPQLHAQAGSRVVEVGNNHVLGVLRESPRGTVLVLANLSARAYSIGLHSAPWFAPGAGLRDLISGHPEERTVRMDPYQVRWLAELPRANR
ncbi:alpha-amylase family glycosyl hydrolase [Enemella evansiae]|uniref:D-apionate lactonase C-terminal domain-containing protein n=1 Tax=Enemella evansiae TaxID=2016499 RepID=A0A255GJW3_9ACTN|nr:hypothetical protein [Enemella evansiae]OYO09265.1 hypothetical protein BI335_18135 [Enemella evansiae]OYO13264.1 hypothetical protein CGZ94_09695 [Enemella evansiae]TDO90032.1 hypothetical protein C8D81_2925 [Enemella evansiae]